MWLWCLQTNRRLPILLVILRGFRSPMIGGGSLYVHITARIPILCLLIQMLLNRSWIGLPILRLTKKQSLSKAKTATFELFGTTKNNYAAKSKKNCCSLSQQLPRWIWGGVVRMEKIWQQSNIYWRSAQ